MKQYQMNVQGSVEIKVEIEVVDSEWNLARVLRGIDKEALQGFNPFASLPSSDEERRGEWRSGEKLVARYCILEIEYGSDDRSGYDEYDNEVDSDGEPV